MSGPAPNQSYRWIALALFVILPLLLASGAAFGALSYFEMNARISVLDDQLQRFRERSGTGDLGAAEPPDVTSIYLSGTTAALAGAELQQLLSLQTAAAFGRVIETSVLDGQPEGVPDAVRVNVVLDIDNGGLLRLLYNLETGVPFLYVGELAMRRLALPTGADGEVGALRVEMVIEGYWRPPAI